MKNTKIISAYPACGKSHFANSGASSCLDSDSSLFSWITKDGQKQRNPLFPGNYITHIKENIGKHDYIFVSSHLAVRQALLEANIDYVTVYPKLTLKSEWLNRMRARGNDEAFIRFQDENFEKFVERVEDEPHGRRLFYLSSGQYIDSVIDKLKEEEDSLFEEIAGDLSTTLNTLSYSGTEYSEDLEALQFELFESRTPSDLALTIEDLFGSIQLLIKEVGKIPKDSFCSSAAKRLWDVSMDSNKAYRIYEDRILASKSLSLDHLLKLPEVAAFMMSLGM